MKDIDSSNNKSGIELMFEFYGTYTREVSQMDLEVFKREIEKMYLDRIKSLEMTIKYRDDDINSLKEKVEELQKRGAALYRRSRIVRARMEDFLEDYGVYLPYREVAKYHDTEAVAFGITEDYEEED